MCLKQLLSYFLILLLLFLSACSGDQKEGKKKVTEAPATSAKKSAKKIEGTVLKVVDESTFTFILLDRGNQKTWATLPSVDVKIGETVVLESANERVNFYSKPLDTTFNRMIFASGIKGKKLREKKVSKQAKFDNGPGGVMKRRSMRLHAAAQATQVLGQNN